MILYDWVKIFHASEGNVLAMFSIFSYLTFPHLPINRYDSTYHTSLEDWSGDSFLLNPEQLFINRKNYKDSELMQYVALASFRSFTEYQATTKTTLNVLSSPIGEEIIRSHRLLSLVKDEVYFCWEEVTH